MTQLLSPIPGTVPQTDRLSGVKKLLENLFGRVGEIGNRFGSGLRGILSGGELISPLPDQPPPAPPTPLPTPAPTPTPQPQALGATREPSALEQLITSGLSQSNFANAPIATLGGQLAQAGSRLPTTVDPLLPTILGLMESGGGQNLSSPNNLYNIGPGISYPSIETSILGGGSNNQLGLAGLLRQGGPYQEFLESGDLVDFFTRFTPSSDPLNPSTPELVQRYNLLRELFVGR